MHTLVRSLHLKISFRIGLLFLIVWLIDSQTVQAQKNEIGFGLGGFNYTGDLARDYRLDNTRLGGVLVYRRNFNDFLSGRLSLTGGSLYGDDTPAFDQLALQRDTAFSIGVVELAGIVEYHFLDYKQDLRLLRWSPYFFIGAGVAFFGAHKQKTEDYNNVQPVIPFGIGFKYIINPVWNVGLEAGVRKTFFDYIDNISGSDLSIKNFEYGNQYDKDWYYFIGLTLNYTFYTIPCPYQFN